MAEGQEIVDCKVTKVLDSNFFEESLSADEYPNVSVEKNLKGLSVSFGMSQYGVGEGDVINLVSSPTTLKIVVKTNDEEGNLFATISLEIQRVQGFKTKHGKIWVKEEGKRKMLIANVDCKLAPFL